MKTFFCCLAVLFLQASILHASPSYYCYKTEQPITVDGKMDEEAWKDIPGLMLRDLVTGAAPMQQTVVKMLWDNQYLYIGFELQDTNIWAECNEPQGPKAKKVIMIVDQFVEILLDPDCDGRNYCEFQVNPLNNLYQTWIGAGSKDKFKHDLDFSTNNYHNNWVCEGLKKAVAINGTLNKPGDTDKSWSVEMAIPWSSLKPFCQGSCPPVTGDVWRTDLGRVYRTAAGSNETYWTWPVIGIPDCHQPDKWGYVIFSDEPAIKATVKSKPDKDKNALLFKMVWVWSMEDKSVTEIAEKAKALGFNAIGWMLPDRTNLVADCHKAGMKLFGVAFFPSAPSDNKYMQVVLPDEEAWLKKIQAGPLKEMLQGGGEPVIGGEIAAQMDFWCLDRPEAMEYGKQLVDKFIREGYDGIAFDAIGYKNFYACFCPVSKAKHETFIKQHPELPRQAAIYKYSEQCLVSFLNTLVGYTKEKKPGMTTTCHIWPDFAPNPLYGNKVAYDYCGQTVSWFYTRWSLDKVSRYTYEVVNQADRYHPSSQGAPFLGIWYPPHNKSPDYVKEEIRMVKESGARGIQLCELSSLLSDPAVAQAISAELDGTYK